MSQRHRNQKAVGKNLAVPQTNQVNAIKAQLVSITGKIKLQTTELF